MQARVRKKPIRAERVRVSGSKASPSWTRSAAGRATLPPILRKAVIFLS